MPTYIYKCDICKEVFEKRHGMFFIQKQCEKCKSNDCVFKLPSLPAKPPTPKQKRTGDVVDKYIKEAKEEVKREKEKLKSEEL